MQASRRIRGAAVAGLLLIGGVAGATIPSGAAEAQTTESCSSGVLAGGIYRLDGCGIWTNQGAPFVFEVASLTVVGPGTVCGGPPGNACPPRTTTKGDVTLVCSSVTVSANGHRESSSCTEQ